MDQLRILRKEFKRTQQQMADMLGITQQAYAAYENNKSQPPRDVLERLADYFDVSVDYLLGRDEKEPTGFPVSFEEFSRNIDAKTAEEIMNLSPEKRQFLFDSIYDMVKNLKK